MSIKSIPCLSSLVPAATLCTNATFLTSSAYALLLRRQRLHVPDHIRILLNTAITAEKAHATYTGNALANPFVLVLIRFVDKRMRLDITIEIIGNEIIVAMFGDGVAESAEAARIAKGAAFDGVKDLCKIRIEGK